MELENIKMRNNTSDLRNITTFLQVGPSSKIGENVTREVFLEEEEFELLLEAVDMTLLFFMD